MGFYEPTEEEQASMNDDPVTLEKPLHTMTFRVRLPDDGPNGEPRYKFFSPAELWRWVKDHDTLPSREGPIWYEDWWALCNTYNPDHHDVPAWAHRLKRRSEYVAERARERAAQAQQAARANARAGREAAPAPAPAAPAPAQPAGVPDPPLRRLPRIASGAIRDGPRNVADHLVQWRFWVKSSAFMDERPDDGSVRPGLLGDSIRYNFGTVMDASGFRVGGSRGGGRIVEHWRWRLLVAVRSFWWFNSDNAGSLPGATKRITCRLYLPRFAAEPFKQWLQAKIDELGMAETCSQLLGVTEAKVLSQRDIVRNRGEYWPQRFDTEPATLPTITQAAFDNWRLLRFRAWGVRGEERYYDEATRVAAD
jgi:hypothetical protein